MTRYDWQTQDRRFDLVSIATFLVGVATAALLATAL